MNALKQLHSADQNAAQNVQQVAQNELKNFPNPAQLPDLLQLSAAAQDAVKNVQHVAEDSIQNLPVPDQLSTAAQNAVQNIQKVAEEQLKNLPADPSQLPSAVQNAVQNVQQIAENGLKNIPDPSHLPINVLSSIPNGIPGIKMTTPGSLFPGVQNPFMSGTPPFGVPPIPRLPPGTQLPRLSTLMASGVPVIDRLRNFWNEVSEFGMRIFYFFFLPISWFFTFFDTFFAIGRLIFFSPLSLFINIWETRFRAYIPWLPSPIGMLNALFPQGLPNFPSFGDLANNIYAKTQPPIPNLPIPDDFFKVPQFGQPGGLVAMPSLPNLNLNANAAESGENSAADQPAQEASSSPAT
ncbi:hypothetical protein EWM64_g484 [Hericium alpestre]|uniref:Uncharacterized protein n=1 Tax=Hericium alpestre TaxID=135208 RepID=A0A4Z0AB24_9AGAM|nr:hypothetical protein EWM64_g484 [Hericium alpestre]